MAHHAFFKNVNYILLTALSHQASSVGFVPYVAAACYKRLRLKKRKKKLALWEPSRGRRQERRVMTTKRADWEWDDSKPFYKWLVLFFPSWFNPLMADAVVGRWEDCSNCQEGLEFSGWELMRGRISCRTILWFWILKSNSQAFLILVNILSNVIAAFFFPTIWKEVSFIKADFGEFIELIFLPFNFYSPLYPPILQG